ncbi:MAG TPA: large conductance mechanosensitive channel protein MscL [Nocardioidaceae bacterium]|nr:large conductance mechanosensitive channel protein MscL [Nocardioidaceae bacterium]
MLKGFKDFVLRGNLIELAVAFVIGTAFTVVMLSLVDNVLMPLIGKIGGEPNFDSIDVAEIPIGAFLTDLVGFVLIAGAVYFFVIVPYNRLLELRKRGEVEAPEAVEENTLLLREIRDALTAKSEGDSTSS